MAFHRVGQQSRAPPEASELANNSPNYTSDLSGRRIPVRRFVDSSDAYHSASHPTQSLQTNWTTPFDLARPKLPNDYSRPGPSSGSRHQDAGSERANLAGLGDFSQAIPPNRSSQRVINEKPTTGAPDGSAVDLMRGRVELGYLASNHSDPSGSQLRRKARVKRTSMLSTSHPNAQTSRRSSSSLTSSQSSTDYSSNPLSGSVQKPSPLAIPYRDLQHLVRGPNGVERAEGTIEDLGAYGRLITLHHQL